MLVLITSVHNEHIKNLEKLKEKKYRDKSMEFLLETKHLQQKMQAERNANYLTIKGLIESKKQKALL